LNDWKPRDKSVLLDNVPWLARMIDKARAKAQGIETDYMFPCPIDRRLLSQAGVPAQDFLEIVKKHQTDEEVVKAFKEKATKDDWKNFKV
jgi:4-hydroxy-L-threonine phosphate dehydrogenase PdxA